MDALIRRSAPEVFPVLSFDVRAVNQQIEFRDQFELGCSSVALQMLEFVSGVAEERDISANACRANQAAECQGLLERFTSRDGDAVNRKCSEISGQFINADDISAVKGQRLWCDAAWTPELAALNPNYGPHAGPENRAPIGSMCDVEHVRILVPAVVAVFHPCSIIENRIDVAIQHELVPILESAFLVHGGFVAISVELFVKPPATPVFAGPSAILP